MIFALVGCVVSAVLTTVILLFCILRLCECRKDPRVTNLSAVIIENQRPFLQEAVVEQVDNQAGQTIPLIRNFRTFRPDTSSLSSSLSSTRSITKNSAAEPLHSLPPAYNEITKISLPRDCGVSTKAR